MDTFEQGIINKEIQIAIVGMGYVGLPLGLAFAQAGFRTTGIDIDKVKVNAINQGTSYIEDISDQELAQHVGTDYLNATTDYGCIADCGAIFICVPTPYTIQRSPDLSYIIAATESIAPYLQHNQLVVLQSTTYPGTTTEIVQPILERESGLHAERDFYLAFSPERIDPGNKTWSAHNTPKVVGGVTQEATQRAAALLRQMGATVHEVSSSAAAEFTKLLENTFRAVNIALVNELALLAERMDLDIWEIINAAKTKPFGYMPFTPGPGVGGHCIPIDPYYLLWKAREYDFYTRFIELAAETNEAMPYHVVDLVTRGLSLHNKSLMDANILVMGVAFKPDIGDARNAPAERVIELLLHNGAKVHYHDPYVPNFIVGDNVIHPEKCTLNSVALTPESIAATDAVVIVTGHHDIDYPALITHASLVVDSCNATRMIPDADNIIRLGSPIPTPH